MPLVSICIPTYNHITYLKKTIESILNQSFQDYEIIITDDSRSTIVKDLLDQYEFKNKLTYHHNRVILGSPKNWNFCISKATGTYIKIMHHDDWFCTIDSLDIFVKAIEGSNNSFVFCDAEVVYANSGKTGSHIVGNTNTLKLSKDPQQLFMGNFIGAPSMTIYRRDSLLAFDENLKWLVDVDFYIRYLNKHPDFYYINKKLVSIITDASHSVTATSYNNKEIEIGENLYLFNKLSFSLTIRKRIEFYTFLLRLLQRFNILKIKKIREIGYKGQVPVFLGLIFCLKEIKNMFHVKNKKYV